MKLAEWVKSAGSRLDESEFSSSDATRIAAHVLGTDFTGVTLRGRDSVDVTDLDAALARRLAGEPLSWIEGTSVFCGHDFIVTSDVLTPRPETETLASVVIERAPLGSRVIDLCTGCGNVAVSVKLARPDLDVVAADVSAAAVDVARENGKALGAAVVFLVADVFEGLSGTFDVICGNPPYISREYPLPPDVLAEPHVALYADNHGDEILTRILREAPEFLSADGFVALEFGRPDQSLRVCPDAEVVLDHNGSPRVLVWARGDGMGV